LSNCANEARLMDGYWVWSAPLGYTNTEDRFGKKVIEIVSEKAEVVRYIFQEYSKGIYSLGEIADKVDKTKLLPQKKIAKQMVRKILNNSLYTGRIEMPDWKVSVDGRHEAIITIDVFNQAHEVMEKASKNKKQRNRYHPDFPLRGIRCGACGGRISGGWTTGRSKRYAYYGCSNKDCPVRKAIQKEKLESAMTKFLEGLSLQSGYVEIIKEAVLIAYRSETRMIRGENKRFDEEIDKLTKRKEKLLELVTDGIITDIEYVEEKRRLEERIESFTMQTVNANLSEADLDNALSFSLNLLSSLHRSWKTLDPRELRALLELLFPKNLFYEHSGIKTADMPFIYGLNQGFEDGTETVVNSGGIGWNQIVKELQAWLDLKDAVALAISA